MDYTVKIDEFEGPLDLLLHLIKQDDIDIYEISIERVVSQYMDYIGKMQELNLTIASTYLVMAAELIEMKSRSLLPKKQTDEAQDDYEEDPKEELIKRLVEYKQYKEISTKFKDLEYTRSFIFTKEPNDMKEYIDDEIIDPEDSKDVNILLKAFQDLLNRKELSKPLNTVIAKKEVSVVERKKQINSILSKKKKVYFDELFDIMTKDYVVVTFLTILEMAKESSLEIKQDCNFDQILILKRGEV